VSSPPASHVEQVHRLFDGKAQAWPEHYQPDGRLLARLVQVTGAVERLTSPGSAVLDLGCASGELARFLARSGYQLTGCDVSGNMLSQARQADPDHTVRWVQLDPAWQRLPFGPATFGTVVMASVLEYMESPDTVLAECARVLRPGGTLIGTVPNLAHPVRWAEWAGQRAADSAPVRRLAARGGPRVEAYLTYLRISRQRHRLGWWHAAAARAGLRPVAPDSLPPSAGAGRPTLRLLAFQTDQTDPQNGAGQ
jgi:SAM-dependent methyltransferase